jgi:hypothetical protein
MSSCRKGQCTRATENNAPFCAPRMNDGRLFTDYRPRCVGELAYKAPMSGSYEYRQFLISNGKAIIDQQRTDAYQGAACGPCGEPFDVSTMVPEVDRVVCDKVSCVRLGVPQQPQRGIGTGREYGSTDEAAAASAAFLSSRRAQQDALRREAADCGCAGGADALQQLPGPARWALPGAGSPLAIQSCAR